MKPSLVLFGMGWWALGQLFKTICQAKTLAGASIEDRLNTRHETDLSSHIRFLKVCWFPGSSHQRLLCHLDWYAGSSRRTIWQLWFAEARKSFEMDRKWSNFSVLFSKTRPLFWAVFLAGLGITTSWHQGAKGDRFGRMGSRGRGSLMWPPKVTNHLHAFVISKLALEISSEKPEDWEF